VGVHVSARSDTWLLLREEAVGKETARCSFRSPYKITFPPTKKQVIAFVLYFSIFAH